MSLSLEPPSLRYQEAWLESDREWGDTLQQGASSSARAGLDLATTGGFATFVERLLLAADPTQDLPSDRVPAINRWIIRDGTYAGAIQLRHGLTPFLARLGGHIGYGVRPSARGRGLAAFALRETLPAARRLGLERVLITCDDDNPASWKTIERCGGVLEAVMEPEPADVLLGFGKPLRRYWVSTTPA